MAALYGNAYLNGQSYKVENNHIQVEEKPKEENYNVNVYVSTFIGDVEVIYDEPLLKSYRFNAYTSL